MGKRKWDSEIRTAPGHGLENRNAAAAAAEAMLKLLQNSSETKRKQQAATTAENTINWAVALQFPFPLAPESRQHEWVNKHENCMMAACNVLTRSRIRSARRLTHC